MKSNYLPLILIAEDDVENSMLAKDAFEECDCENPLFFVRDGEELMRFLKNKPPYEDKETFPLPGLILIDLNLPKKDGREATAEIKADPELRKIPLIILTTSSVQEDIHKSYKIGANSYITKPISFKDLVEVMKGLCYYWFEIVQLPPITNNYNGGLEKGNTEGKGSE